MKKLIFLTFLFITLFSFPKLGNAQMLGKWVIPTMASSEGHEALLLTFTSDDYPQSSPLPNILNDVDYCQIAAGAYNPSYDLMYYIIDNTLLFDGGNQNFEWNTSTLYGAHYEIFKPEYQIISKPGVPDKYYTFFVEMSHAKTLTLLLFYNEIWYENNEWHVSERHNIINNTDEDDPIAFALSEENNDNERTLYAGSGPWSPGIQNQLAGITKWGVSSTGVNYIEHIVSSDHINFIEDDFLAYNLEMKTDANGDDVIAWTNQNETSSDVLYVVTKDSQLSYDLGYGRIGGIEFSSLYPNVIYVSCTDEGIVAIDYNDGTEIETLQNSANYGRTFLQTAPDGHIYGVSDNGTNLGRINMQTGEFESAVFSLNTNYFISSFRVYDNLNYYILPENDREYCPLSATLELKHVCPDHCDGEAWVDESTITCGHAPYTFTWYDEGNQVIGSGNHIYNLCEGIYHVEIQDFYDKLFEEEFVITVDPEYWDFDLYQVEQDEEWNSEILSFWHGIDIKAGNELILNNCDLKFLKPAKITIEQGARLIVNNSKLSYFPECDGKWQGIEVWGDISKHQYEENGVRYQGYLELKNSSEVSYAEVGVSLYEATFDEVTGERIIHWNTGGGIVKSYGTDFINNTKSIHFVPYSNYMAPDMYEIEMPNLSGFELNNFDINASNIGSNIFYKHVDLHGVNGIGFSGCTFTNSAIDYVSHWNLGIAAYGAGFEVNAFCTQPMNPCPPQYTLPSSFDGFYWGIGSYSSLEYTYPFQIWDANFTNNHTGIYVPGVSFGVMINNDFDIGLINPGGGLCDDEAFGIDMFEATGFAIEDNDFEKMPNAPKANYVGVRIKNTNSGYDEVYRNTFEGLSFANLAEGKNWKEEDIWTGLAYYCNGNTANWADFWVSQIWPSGIQARQGDDDHAAGNIFSSNSMWHFYNGGQFEIGYYYCATCPGEIPDDHKLYHVTDEAKYVQNLCPDQYGGSGGNIELTSGERLQKETEYFDNLNDYNSIKSQYDAFVDGGNSEVELTDVQTAQPDEMWELRAQLLGHSPHLSLEVLMEASDRTDVFPNDALFDILSANPDELKKDTLISYLENKENPLPDYMIAILQQVANGTTYKTVLQNQMAYYNRNKSKAAYDIVRSIMVDTTSDITDIRNWLDNIGGIRSDEQIIATYMQENNYSDALSLANMLPVLYEFSGVDSIEHIYFMDLLNLQINIKQQGRNIFQLDSTELTTLLIIADNSLSTAGTKARSILEYAYNYNYCNCLDLSDTSAYKNENNNWSNFDKLSSVEITAQPNPASTWAAFNYTLPGTDSRGSIRIADISGKLIQTIDIRGKQGQYVWDTRFVKTGVYLYTIQVEGLSKTGKIVISK